MNPHYGNIGDVVKHLVLGELLDNIQPARYIESHSGCASYPLKEEVGRHDSLAMLRACGEDGKLAYSVFTQLLASCVLHKRYPGSPAISMQTLRNHSEYHFFDIQEKTLQNIIW